MKSIGPELMRRVVPILLVLVATAIVFARVPFSDFVVPDDRGNIFENPWLEKDAAVGISAFWKQPYRGLYIPVTYTAWGLLVKLSFAAGWTESLAEIPAAPFHAANLLLHLGAVAIVFSILRRLFPKAAPFTVAMGALVFAVHPLQVEPVAWATGLRDVLSGCLGFVAILFYLRWLDEDRPAESRPTQYGIAFAAFALALLAKPTSVSIPVIAGILALAVVKAPPRRVVTSLAPWLLPVLAAVLASYVAHYREGLTFSTPYWVRPFVAAEALWFYFAKLFWPIPLCPVYDRPAGDIVASFGIGRAVLLLFPFLLAAFAAWRWKNSARRVGFAALAVWIAGYLPVHGFVPFDYQRLSIVADRYSYISLLGPAVFLTWMLQKKYRLPAIAVAGIALGFFAVQAGLQTRHWRDYRAHIDHGLALYPESAFFHNLDGLLHTRENRDDEAIAAFEKAVSFDPDFARCHANLGVVLKRQNRPQDALVHLLRTVEIDPKNASYRFEYGYALFELGKNEEALPSFEQAASLKPGMVEAHLFQALSLRYIGRLDDAVDRLEHGVSLGASDWRVYLELGSLYRKLDKDHMATLCFHSALESDPLPDDPRRLLQVGWLRAASPEAELRDGPRAVEIARDGIPRFGNLPMLGELLAASHAESGDFAEASKLAGDILEEIDQSNPALATLVDRLKRQRKLYDQGKAWRQ